ncbi:hypothetical protein KSS87_004672 [Heliosperma pusillum]|nr:hypothetical protein KSS87_004672 [Heliosperma pusillum]
MEEATTTTITTTPPSNKVKSASRLSQLLTNKETNEIPHFQVEYITASPSPPKPRKTPSSITPSKLSVTKTRGCLPMHQLLLNLSPSPVSKSRTRLSDRLDLVDEQGGGADVRRKCKTRISSNGFSPRNVRRSRRRIEIEEREILASDDLNKPKKRRNSSKSKKEKPIPVNSALPSKENDEGESALDRLGLMIWDLVMWRDVSKSSFCLFSVISQLGLVFLAVSFMSNILHQREIEPKRREVCLKEEDFLKVIRVVLPVLNLAISKTAQLFSGEPSMTLKVASFFMFGAEYGHLLTLRRLCVLGFFTSFTAPKLYSSYAALIDSKAFISLVVLRYYRQHSDNRKEVDTIPIPRKENSKLEGNLTVEEEQVNETQH